MDIQKQREAFEKFITNKYKDLIDQRVCINSDSDYMGWDMQVAWATWQAAQSVPEGFVLVPKEPTEEMMFAGYESKEKTDNLKINYRAMVEAQEQSHD